MCVIYKIAEKELGFKRSFLEHLKKKKINKKTFYRVEKKISFL